jgi:hypothetical protein
MGSKKGKEVKAVDYMMDQDYDSDGSEKDSLEEIDPESAELAQKFLGVEGMP